MDRDTLKIASSILAANFARLDELVTQAEKAGANRIHVDVMDGHFVPNHRWERRLCSHSAGSPNFLLGHT